VRVNGIRDRRLVGRAQQPAQQRHARHARGAAEGQPARRRGLRAVDLEVVPVQR
jgi:hypothetical protein